MKKRVVILLIIVSVAMNLWALGGSEDGVKKIKISSDLPSSHMLVPLFNEFAEELKTKSNGTLIAEWYLDSTLGSMTSTIDSVRQGTIQMVTTATELSVYDPILAIFDFPFLFDNYEQAKKIAFESDIFKKVAAERLPEKANLRMIDFYPLGFRTVVSKKPVTSAEDLVGLRLRVPNIPMYLSLFKNLGINGQVVNWGESITAIESGVIDGMDGAFASMFSLNLYEVAPYFYPANYILLMYSMVVNEDFYQDLSAEHKDIFTSAIKTMCGKIWDATMKEDQRCIDWLNDNGYTVVFPSERDIEILKNKAAPSMEEFYSKVEGSRELVEEIKKMK